jgi:hypothetical protein
MSGVVFYGNPFPLNLVGRGLLTIFALFADEFAPVLGGRLPCLLAENFANMLAQSSTLSQ